MLLVNRGLAVATEARVSWWHAAHAHGWANSWTRASGNGWVRAEHANAGTELGTTEGHHMLTNVASNNLLVLWIGVGEDILNQIVSILVAGDIDEWDTRTVVATLAHALKVATEELNAADLEAFLDHLGSELIHAVFRGITDDMINSTSAISRGAVLADVLNTPVTKLAMGDDIDASQNFLNAWALTLLALFLLFKKRNIPCPPLGSSQKCSELPSFLSHQEQPRATCHEAPR